MNQERRRDLGRAGRVAAATMSSRVLGLAREHIQARLFGVGMLADAFVIAYRIPNLLRELVAEGALSSAFVPGFTDRKERRGDLEAFLLGQIVFTGLFAIVGTLTLLAYLQTESLVRLMVPGFADVPGKLELTVDLTRWMLPFLLFAAWAAICRGMLNAYHRFFLPALAPALFNLVAVLTGLVLLALDVEESRAIYWWAVAMLAGGAAQFLIQLPSLHRLGFRLRPRFRFRDPGFLRILRIMAPATLGLAAVQINIFVNSRIASEFEVGANAMLNYAYRLVYLPIGVIGVAIATVSTVKISRDLARADHAAFHQGLTSSLRLVLFLTLPAAAGLITLGQPIVDLLYGYGAFAEDPSASAQTSRALGLYAIGLFCFAGVKVLAPAFYALDRARIAVVASASAVVANLVWSVTTAPQLGWLTLAAGTALAGLVNFAVLAAVYHRSFPLPVRELALFLAKVMVLCLPMSLCGLGLHHSLQLWLDDGSATHRMATTALPIAASIAIYLVLARGWGLAEGRDIWALLARSSSRSSPGEPQ